MTALAERLRGHVDRSVAAIAAVAAIGLVGRILYTLDRFAGVDDLFGQGDAFMYSTTATNSARGHWFDDAFGGNHFADHPPLTVASLIPTGWLFPDSIMAQRLTFCLVGAVSIVVIGLFARRLAGPVAGVGAAVVAAANPNLWMNDAVIMSESISTPLIAGLLWASLGLRQRPSLRRAVLVGALCGLTILARAEIGLFLPLLIVPVIALARDLSWRDRALRSGAAVVAAALVVAPWTLWNTVEFEGPVLISSNDGTTLLGANCPAVYGDSEMVGFWSLECVVAFNDAQATAARGLDASEVSKLQREEGLRYIRANVRSLPKVLVARVGRTFGYWGPSQQVWSNQGEGRPTWASWAGYGTFWALIPVSIAGAAALRRRRGDLLPALATLATVFVVSAAFYGIPRFRLPLDIMTCVLAGVVASVLWARIRGGDGPVVAEARRLSLRVGDAPAPGSAAP